MLTWVERSDDEIKAGRWVYQVDDNFRSAHRIHIRYINTGTKRAVGYYVCHDDWDILIEDVIAGPFDTLDGAKVAYLMLVGTRL